MGAKINTVDRLIQNRFLSHFVFWIGLVALFTIIAALNSGDIREPLISYLSFLPVQMMAGYLLVYYQVPKLLLKKKYVLFAITFLVSVYLFSVMARLASVYIAEPLFRENFHQEGFIEIISDPLYLVVVYFPVVYVVVFLMLITKIIKDRFEAKHELELIQKEKATTELKFLRAQIHPHFLFNTLNNLYALTLSKSDTAPEVVLKLSDMLDYMLYQCNEPTVSVSKEIELLKSYIDLEHLRFGDKLHSNFTHNCDDENAKVAPLILLSFVENAFKHGARENLKNSEIDINLQVHETRLTFQVNNSKTVNSTDAANANLGIGTTNAKRQLELNYKDRYDLEVQETKSTYCVILTIEL